MPQGRKKFGQRGKPAEKRLREEDAINGQQHDEPFTVVTQRLREMLARIPLASRQPTLQTLHHIVSEYEPPTLTKTKPRLEHAREVFSSYQRTCVQTSLAIVTFLMMVYSRVQDSIVQNDMATAKRNMVLCVMAVKCLGVYTQIVESLASVSEADQPMFSVEGPRQNRLIPHGTLLLNALHYDNLPAIIPSFKTLPPSDIRTGDFSFTDEAQPFLDMWLKFLHSSDHVLGYVSVNSPGGDGGKVPAGVLVQTSFGRGHHRRPYNGIPIGVIGELEIQEGGFPRWRMPAVDDDGKKALIPVPLRELKLPREELPERQDAWVNYVVEHVLCTASWTMNEDVRQSACTSMREVTRMFGEIIRGNQIEWITQGLRKLMGGMGVIGAYPCARHQFLFRSSDNLFYGRNSEISPTMEMQTSLSKMLTSNPLASVDRTIGDACGMYRIVIPKTIMVLQFSDTLVCVGEKSGSMMYMARPGADAEFKLRFQTRFVEQASDTISDEDAAVEFFRDDDDSASTLSIRVSIPTHVMTIRKKMALQRCYSDMRNSFDDQDVAASVQGYVVVHGEDSIIPIVETSTNGQDADHAVVMVCGKVVSNETTATIVKEYESSVSHYLRWVFDECTPDNDVKRYMEAVPTHRIEAGE